MMTQKATLMILGSHHLDNPGRDHVNFQADDVLSAKRQREVRQLVALLKQFRPTILPLRIHRIKMPIWKNGTSNIWPATMN
jgi:hypothetical protein